MTGDLNMQYQTSNKTSGWVIFVGSIAAVAAIGNMLYGLMLLFNDEWVVLTPNAVVAFDLTTVGVTYLIFGALLLVISFGIFNGDLWARVLGIIAASLNIIAQMAFMSVYPEWSWLLIIVNALIIYGLAVHGDEVAKF
jgi:hypothetical protein